MQITAQIKKFFAALSLFGESPATKKIKKEIASKIAEIPPNAFHITPITNSIILNFIYHKIRTYSSPDFNSIIS